MSNPPTQQESFCPISGKQGSVEVCFVYTEDHAWEAYGIHIHVSNNKDDLEENTRATLMKLLEHIDKQGSLRPAKSNKAA